MPAFDALGNPLFNLQHFPFWDAFLAAPARAKHSSRGRHHSPTWSSQCTPSKLRTIVPVMVPASKQRRLTLKPSG